MVNFKPKWNSSHPQDCGFYIDRGLLYVGHVYKWLLWVTQNCHASWIQWRNCCSISCTCTYMYELRYIDIISVCFDELILTLIVECFRTRPLKKVEENRIYYIYLFKFFFKIYPLFATNESCSTIFFFWGGVGGMQWSIACIKMLVVGVKCNKNAYIRYNHINIWAGL